MTTLAANTPRDFEGGNRNEIPVIASDIIFEGAAVGIVTGTGHARPLAAGDRFAGFAEAKADNSAGAAAAINVRVIESGKIQLAVTGAVITDVGQPVYATDDNVFAFAPTSAVFVGFVHRFVSSAVVIVEFDAMKMRDPYEAWSGREPISATKTLDAGDTGKLLWIDTDAFVITLPAIADGYAGGKVVNGGAYGTILISLSPQTADAILGPDMTAVVDKDLLNTKATAQRGDAVQLGIGDADGYVATDINGTWVKEG